MKIRVATYSDIPILVEMGTNFIQESPTFKNRGFQPEKATQHFKWLLDGNGVIFVVVKGEQIIGGFVGGITMDWQSNHKLAFDYVMYVHPNYRSSGAGKMLVEAFILWAKEMGADRINCGTATMVNTQQCIALYESLGFTTVGAFLDLEV